MRFAAIIFLLVAIVETARGQYFQFSQYDFTNLRINPGIVASSDYAEASLLSRKQSTGGGFHLNSNFFNASYPFINSKGKRWSGVGISLMDDRAGQNGLFSTQEVSIAYAFSIPVAKYSSLSLGFKGLHSRRKVDVDGLYTGLQYVPDRGFDEARNAGEDFSRFSNTFNTFSAGIFWRKEDKKKMTLATAGLAFFDLNNPDDSFFESASAYASSFIGSFSYRLRTNKNLSFYPELLLTLSGGIVSWNGGFVTSYELKRYRKRPSDRIEIITKLRSLAGPLIGARLHKENFSVGISYDTQFGGRRASNHGAVEVGLSIRRLVEPARSSRRKKKSIEKKSSGQVQARTKKVVPVIDSTDTVVVEQKPISPSLSDRLKARQDSVRATGWPGEISHEPLVLEKATLHFSFEFNSSELDEESSSYLRDVARALVDNPELSLELTGHTDNVGSAKFNLRLSRERAESIRTFLIAEGVDEDRIIADGKGLSDPLNENLTEEERKLNRRVEMKIVYDR